MGHTLIRNRAPAFLAGRSFTVKEVEDLQETVRVCRGLSWAELVRTVCEHLDWVAPTGRYKVESCGKALVKLEALGLGKLPVRRAGGGPGAKIVMGAGTDPEEEMVGTARDAAPVKLEPVRGREAIRPWNEYVDRYHPLGYKRPFGAHQRYFVEGRGDVGWAVCCLRRRPGRWGSGTAG